MTFVNKFKEAFILIISAILYFYVAFFLERSSFFELLFCWITLFGSFYYLIKNNQLSFKDLIGIAILFRLIFLFATPNLSQDFYRFIWDGRMIFEGFNPYLSTPESFIERGLTPINDALTLYESMGILNGSHYTNYPPIHQISFLIAALFANKSIFGSVIVLRFIIIIADVGILYFGKKLLERLQLPVKNIFWYFLNPFVIIETTGNLHFEPLMLFFLVLSLYKLHQQKWILAAIFMGCSVSVKLIPLLFLPLFIQWFHSDITKILFVKKESFFYKIKKMLSIKLVLFYGIIFTTILVLFAPFLSNNLITNYLKSVGLWFHTFEFNASFYYLFREIGYLFRGYNEIAVIGKIMAICTITFIIILSFFKDNQSMKKLLTSMLFAISFYYFFSSTVHPWYIATPLLLSVFTKFTFPIIWSFVLVLSYNAYASLAWKENLWLVAFEYILLFSYFIYEIKKHNLKKLIN